MTRSVVRAQSDIVRALLLVALLVGLLAMGSPKPAGAAANGAGSASSSSNVAAAANTLVFTATQDAYVQASTPTKNYGTAKQLIVDNSPVKDLLLEFNVSGLGGQSVTSVKLRLYCVNPAPSGGSFRAVADTSWAEKTVNWNNQPAANGPVLGTIGKVASGNWYEIDVTPLVTGDGVISIQATSTASDGAYYSSKEGTAGFAPQLVVTTAASSTPPTNTAPPTIAGTTQQGATLTASSGTWNGTAPISYAYQWLRCNTAGAACQDITGAAAVTYTLGADDAGSTLRVAVTASNSAGSASASSAQTAVVSGSGSQPSFPIRAAFYYAWYPETWTVGGQYTHYTPSLGYYSSTSTSVIQQHLQALRWAKIAVGISSWWGQGTTTDTRLPTLLSVTDQLGSSVRWTVYYEQESQGDPSVSQITSDLTYLRDKYAGDSAFLKINGRFVVFVYADANDGCAMADRWKQANTVGAYIVLKVFPGYSSCASQPDSWHQYASASAESGQSGYAFEISPGFYKADETSPRLTRDLTRWSQNVRDMVASNAPWQLITTFNEWGEGTAVESANEWASSSGYGAYLDALHADGQGTATPPTSTSPPTISGAAQVGQTLTASPGGWSGTAPISYAYQWRRCDTAGANCVDIVPAATTQYTPVSGDVGSTLRVAVTASNSVGMSTASSSATATVVAAGSSDPVLAAAGDIACNSAPKTSGTTCNFGATSDLITNDTSVTAVVTLGDGQYECGDYTNYLTYFGPTWGRFRSKTHPTAGNHDYQTSPSTTACDPATTVPGKGYFDYWNGVDVATGPAGDRAKGYYSYDIGSWHLIALNSNCSNAGGCNAGSSQETWLKNDLSAHPTTCTLAYWHHPRFSSGEHGNNSSVAALWNDLYSAGADVVLNGHDHDYERFAPQNPSAVADPAYGIREFIVGTGGKSHYGFVAVQPNSDVRNATTFGVLKLTLRTTGYAWQFVPEAGSSFTDSGTDSCHGAPGTN